MNDSFSFTYEHAGTHINMSFAAETWHEALNKFVSFLGTVQGYDLSDKIAADISPYALDKEAWTGPIFNPEENL